jgi:hypothetical protein
MNCKRYQKLIHEYLDDALSSGLRSSIEEHLKACDDCRKAFAQERAFSESATKLLREGVHSMSLHPDILPKVQAVLESGASSPRIPSYQRNVLLRPALALGVAAVLATVAFAILRNHQPPQPTRRVQPVPERLQSYIMCMATTYADETKTDWIERRLIVEMKNGIDGYLKIIAKKPAKPTQPKEEKEAES